MIGDWNNDNCVWGFLPKCWQLGESPATVSSTPGAAIYTGPNIPIYQGPEAATESVTVSATIDNGGILNSLGYLDTATNRVSGATHSCVVNTNYQPVITNESEFTVEQWYSWVPTTSTNNSYISGQVCKVTISKSIQIIHYKSFSTIGPCLWFSMRNTGTGNQGYVLRTVETPIVGKIYHVVCTKNGSTLKIYLDGYELTTTAPTVPDKLYTGGTVDFRAGDGFCVGDNHEEYTHSGLRGNFYGCNFYNKDIGATRIRNNAALGYSLGGLKGTQSGIRLNLTTPTSNNSGNSNNFKLVTTSSGITINTLTCSDNNYVGVDNFQQLIVTRK